MVLLLAWLRLSGPARAEPGPSDYDASIQQAIVEFDAGHWDEARALFRQAHAISPSARTWRGLAITAFELRRYVDASQELKAALSDTQKPLTDTQRAELEELLQRTRAFLSSYRLSLQPADLTLSVDGGPGQPNDGELLLDPGPHALSFRAPGYLEQRLELHAEAGQHSQLAITLPPEPEVSSLAASEPVRAQEAAPKAALGTPSAKWDAPAPRYLVAWTLGGASALSALTAVTLGALAKRDADRYQGCSLSPARCEHLRSEGMRYQTATNVMFGVAGACAIGAVLGYFLERRSSRLHAPKAGISFGLSRPAVAVHAQLPF